MTQARELDPSASVLAYFGSELRRFRLEANLTQTQLGEAIIYTGALVGLVETAKRTPARDFTERCDTVLNTGGALMRLLPLLNRGVYPSWFRGYVELEATATRLLSFDVQVVPGLLQTEGYARAVLSAGRHPNVDELVTARLDRQHILKQPNPPLYWVVLDEGVLRRRVGGPEVMREQLKRLVEVAVSPRIVVQVLPYEAGAHAGVDGPLTILSFDEGTDAVYIEGIGSGQLMTRPEEVERCHLIYDLVRAVALSPEASVDMIATTMEEL